MLLAKGYNGGQIVKETKVETTGEPAAVQLVPDRPALQADGDDVAVFTVRVVDAQGRVVPTAGNNLHFDLSGPGKILGVGNGDPSSHEPDTFVVARPVKTIAISDWRWHLAPVPTNRAPAYASDFDDSAWQPFRASADNPVGDQLLQPGQTAIFRAHLMLTEADLANPEVQLGFSRIDDDGWVFINNQFVGEAHDWAAQPTFAVKPALHVGNNVIAVGVVNRAGPGGLNAEVNLKLIGQPPTSVWQRSAFNGLAQILVQATRDAGEIKLTANADGLQPATTTIPSIATPARPFVP